MAALPPARQFGEDVRKPPRYAGRVALAFWRLQLWFECTFGLTVMEPWERMVVRAFCFCSLGQVQLLSFASSHLFHGHLATCMHWSRTILPTEARRSTTKDGVLFVGSSRGSSGRSPAFVVTGY